MSRGSTTGPGAGSDRNPEVDRDGPPGEGPPDIDEGRYLYCAVRVDDGAGEGGEAPEDPAEFEATGVDDESVSLVTVDGVGAVVHACEGLYDSSDLAQVRRWLVRHQSVVDEAGEAFGTPLPFQFDTIVRGDDEAVRDWLRREYDAVAGALDSLAGHWEYRIEVVSTDPVPAATLAEEDERLADLREQIDDADEGAAFLLEKQYEDRLSELRENRRAALLGDLRERLADRAREVHELERSPSASLETDDESDEDGETVGRLTLLADEDEEGAIGSILDDVAAEPGLEVRFTGPWPPYTFAPELGGGSAGDGGGGGTGDGGVRGDRTGGDGAQSGERTDDRSPHDGAQ